MTQQSHDPIKQIILYRRDLKMRKGKIAAQVAHASLRVILRMGTPDPQDPLHLTLDMTPDVAAWVHGRFVKIVLSVEDEAALVGAYEEAKRRGLPASLITDAGKTEFHGQPTRTTVAIGPARSSEIDPITGPNGVIATKLA